MLINEHAQETLELFWLAQETSRPISSQPALTPGGLEELLRLGLITGEPPDYTLTTSGQHQAALAIRRHRLGERLLADLFQAEGSQMEEHACLLEHALFAGLDESICTLLGHPQFCPHGKPIPPGECCRQSRSEISRLIAPLSDLQPGQSGSIAYIQTGDAARLQKLMAMGVMPGTSISLVRRSPSYVFTAGFSQFAVDEDIASGIFVRLIGK